MSVLSNNTTYAELAVTTNFSFLRGGSHGDELVRMAHALGLGAIGVADRNTLAGVVRAHLAAKEVGLKLLVGARLVTEDGFEVICYPRDRAAYGRLSQLLTLGNRRAPKGECFLTLDDIAAYAEGQIFIVMPPWQLSKQFIRQQKEFRSLVSGKIWMAAAYLYRGDDLRRLSELEELARDQNVHLVATNDVHYHDPLRRVLQDILTCIREHVSIDEAGFRLFANAERHLKAPEEMARLFQFMPEALQATKEIVSLCQFSLDELAYEYPDEVLGEGTCPQETLQNLTATGALDRYPDGVPSHVQDAIDHELELIGELSYAPYFLTVYDLVRFARERGILCQGRGSAANSVVCYCLGVTAVDPTKVDLLFERFISAERNEPPDIDVDFEHERREEVIQYIYEKYGRHRAGIAATVTTYRSRSAIREVGKVLGLSEDMVGAMAKTIWGMSSRGVNEDQVREAGLDPADDRVTMALDLVKQLIGFPRHLSQHVGGFVITRRSLDEVIPIANAAMADRTYVEWDKDDLDALGILKIDVLALGMLTAIAKAFDLFKAHYDRHLHLANLPPEDPRVYDMLCTGDSLGVFQVESRAQMTMLPRLKPRNFYDLVIEVAIVRPGPIQGDMVHPYLRRRNGEEKVSFPSEELRRVLAKTMGVPLFQEQAMKIAIVAAGFTPSEADRLRRAMATFRKVGTIHTFGIKLIEGMVANGYEQDFAERCFKQIEGFGEYGFPESHAASFALLVYVSAWIKCHYPDVFCCAMLNSQPLGFYAPAQLVRDAREHGAEMRAIDVNHSFWDCTLEPADEVSAPSDEGGNAFAVRLGFRQIKGFKEEDADRLTASRPASGFDSVRGLWLKTGLSPKILERLARADAFRSLGLDRRAALWAVKALGDNPLPLFMTPEVLREEERVLLPAMPLGEHVVHDYAHVRLSLKAHPISFLRERFAAKGYIQNDRLQMTPDGRRVQVCGLVLVRQRPGSASGVIFATLEDECGVANIVIWPRAFEKYRREVLGSRILGVRGRVQKQGLVIHVVADELVNLSHELGSLVEADEEMAQPVMVDPTRGVLPGSRDFH